MAKHKLKDFTNTTEFLIIDEWTSRRIGTFSHDEAIAKYGECDVWASYTSGGYYPEFTTDVWIWIPGMHCGVSNQDPFTIPGEVKEYPGYREITFTGKKTGQKITVTEYSAYDYNVYFHNDDYSIRGEAKDVYEELKEEL